MVVSGSKTGSFGTVYYDPKAASILPVSVVHAIEMPWVEEQKKSWWRFFCCGG